MKYLCDHATEAQCPEIARLTAEVERLRTLASRTRDLLILHPEIFNDVLWFNEHTTLLDEIESALLCDNHAALATDTTTAEED